MPRIALLLALVLGPATVHALDVVLDYQYDESGFFADPDRRAVLEHAVRLYTRAVDAELGELPHGEWAAVFPHPGRANAVVYRDLAVERSTLHIFVASHPRTGGEPARGVPGYTAWRCETPDVPGACARSAAEHSPADQRAWLERFAFRANPAAAAWPARAFAPWGGALSFASDVHWYVGVDGPVPAGQVDLLSSAVHALGHVFGVGTSRAWAARAVRGHFEGPETEAEGGGAVALTPDRMHFAPGVTGRAAGGLQAAAFSDPVVPGRRAWLTALDEAALRDIGWVRASAASTPELVVKGDVDGDLVVDLEDVLALEAYLALPGNELEQSEAQRALAARVEARWAAADVAPMLDGEALGDGRLDASDAALLRRAIRVHDVDGDGIPTVLENQLNERFAASAGPLIYQPLERRADACATSPGHPLLAFASNGRAAPFCGADGAAWFAVPFVPLRPPPPDAAFVLDRMQLAPISFEAHSFSLSSTSSGTAYPGSFADAASGQLLRSVTIRMSPAWSLRPDVSPELYLETVRAEARVTALAAPLEVDVEAATLATQPYRERRAPGLPARRLPAIAPSPLAPPPDVGSPGDPAAVAIAEAPTLAWTGPAPDPTLEPVAGPAVGLAADELPDAPRFEPVSSSTLVRAGRAGPAPSVAAPREADPPEPPEALLSRLLDALSALWERMRSLVGL